jgi:hypothetical protein
MAIGTAELSEAGTSTPIHTLRSYLETARLQAVENAASSYAQSGAVAPQALHELAHLHMALQAVREEIDAHLPRLGSGSERPLE